MKIRHAFIASVALFTAFMPPASAQDSIDLLVPVPPQAVMTGGTLMLRYELHLTNPQTRPLTIERLDIAADGDPLVTLSSAELARYFALVGPFSKSDVPLAVPAGRRAILYLDLPVAGGRTPRSLTHRLDLRGIGNELHHITLAPVSIGMAPIAVAAPLRGGAWAAIHFAEWPRGHRRMLYTLDGRMRVPGRFAIDFVKVDEQGKTIEAAADPDRPASAIGYGAEMIAVADARVAAVRDTMAESASVNGNPSHSIDDAAGNYVSLDLGKGHYALYEHLKPGSIRVKAGERVRLGQTIAALGFTGDSTGPHLHFHIAEAPIPLRGEGLAFVFSRFDDLGVYPDLSELGSARWHATADDRARRMERPRPNSVIRFPG